MGRIGCRKRIECKEVYYNSYENYVFGQWRHLGSKCSQSVLWWKVVSSWQSLSVLWYHLL